MWLFSLWNLEENISGAWLESRLTIRYFLMKVDFAPFSLPYRYFFLPKRIHSLNCNTLVLDHEDKKKKELILVFHCRTVLSNKTFCENRNILSIMSNIIATSHMWLLVLEMWLLWPVNLSLKIFNFNELKFK